jgi:hypothetical protein
MCFLTGRSPPEREEQRAQKTSGGRYARRPHGTAGMKPAARLLDRLLSDLAPGICLFILLIALL